MPTGYTADIAKGISFQEYALRCARNFGALIMMRDEPMDAPIPDEFKPGNYHIEALEKAHKEKYALDAASPKELKALADKKYLSDKEYYSKTCKEYAELLKKYLAMLEQAKAYKPPTDRHVGYAQFLVSQIEESIKWDCDASHLKAPEKMTGEAFKKERLNKIAWDIDYHTKGNADEVKRMEERSLWVKQLKESLNPTTP